jgi:hypothetical protein
LFSQCPPVGNDKGCEYLITVTAASHGIATSYTIASDPNEGPFDGPGDANDTLFGIVNNSGSYLTSIVLSSSSDIFNFDGDGACSGDYGVIPGCPNPPLSTSVNSGYDPIGVFYSNVNPAKTSGTVNFAPALQNGQSTWFSLEAQLNAPEPASLFLLGLGFSGAAVFMRRRAA